MIRQDRTNPSTAVSNWKGRLNSLRGHPSTAVSSWLNGGLFGGGVDISAKAGYFAGGYDNGGNMDSIEQITFPADVIAMLALTLPSGAGRNSSGFGNDGVAGYFHTGQSNSATITTTIDKLVFATATISALSTGLSVASQSQGQAMSNVGVAGYVAHGGVAANPNSVNSMDKFAYSNDSRTTVSSGLSQARSTGMGFANSGTAGYIGGGFQWAGSYTYYDTVDKFAFPGDSRSSLSSGLPSNNKYAAAGFANSGTAGYASGGGATIPARTTDVAKWAFSDDSRTTLSTGLSEASTYCAGMANSGVAG